MKRIKEVIPYAIGFVLGFVLLFIGMLLIELIGAGFFHTMKL